MKLSIRIGWVGLVVFCLAEVAAAFSETGHHVAAVVAYNTMDRAERSAVMELLSHHPQFDKHFIPPRGVTDPEAINRWRIGVAGCWPDLVRDTDYDRPTWHYQLAATRVLGNIRPPRQPGSLPVTATLATQDLYIGQATELCVSILFNQSAPKAERAIALCWVLHLYADGHQPCHAGSLYAPAFPTGDRGGNAIKFAQGNLHSTWDGLLGGRAKPADVRRRVAELESISVRDSTVGDGLRPSTWLVESAAIGRQYVYTDEVLGPVIAASRGLTDGVVVTLSDEYLRVAGDVARRQVKLAGLRLGELVSRSVRAGPRTPVTPRRLRRR